MYKALSAPTYSVDCRALYAPTDGCIEHCGPLPMVHRALYAPTYGVLSIVCPYLWCVQQCMPLTALPILCVSVEHCMALPILYRHCMPRPMVYKALYVPTYGVLSIVCPYLWCVEHCMPLTALPILCVEHHCMPLPKVYRHCMPRPMVYKAFYVPTYGMFNIGCPYL